MSQLAVGGRAGRRRCGEASARRPSCSTSRSTRIEAGNERAQRLRPPRRGLARAAADAVDAAVAARRRPRPARRRAARRQGPPRLRRHADLARLAVVQGRAAGRPTTTSTSPGCAPPGRCRSARPRRPSSASSTSPAPRPGASPATRGTLERTPGGSSSGSAAAVAAGIVPAGDGQRRRRVDPHPGRLLRARRPQAELRAGAAPRADAAARPASSASSRPTVADAARCLDVQAGPDDRDRTSLPAAGRALRGRASRRCRVAGLRARLVARPRLRRPRRPRGRRADRGRRPSSSPTAAGLVLDDEPVHLGDDVTRCGCRAACCRSWTMDGLEERWPARAERADGLHPLGLESSEAMTAPKIARIHRRRYEVEQRVSPRCSTRSTCCSRPSTAVPAFAAAGPPPGGAMAHAVHDARQPVLEPVDVGPGRPHVRRPARRPAWSPRAATATTSCLRLARILEQARPSAPTRSRSG